MIAAAVTYGLWQHNVYLSTIRVQDKVLSIAVTAALQFDANDLDKLRTADDIKKPEYSKVIYLLNEIRRQNEDVKYIYIMRPTKDPNTLEFVADADSLDPYAKKDLNEDGLVDEADLLSPPGQPYDIKDIPAIQESLALSVPTADKEPYTDQWGTFISGHAPIKDANGNLTALLGVDIFASKIYDFTQDSFYPILTFLGLFILFIIVRLAAFNRSLFKELWEIFQIKRAVILISVCGAVSIAITLGFYFYGIKINTERVREKVTSIAATSALQFSADELRVLKSMDDVSRPEYKNVTTRLDAIRKQNSEIIYMYIIRPTEQKGLFTFVADADAIDPFTEVDTNEDGKITDADTLGLPGLEYDTTNMDALMGEKYSRPVANSKPYTDKWGSFITGYAPIHDAGGNIEAVIAVDMWADKVYELTNRTFSPIIVFILFFGLFLFFRKSAYKKSLLHQLLKLIRKKSVLFNLGSCLIISALITFGMYQYTLNLMKQEIGQRLLSIAVTAVPEFSAEDLEKIHTREDMKTDEYQKIYKKLNEIKHRNKNIRYIYFLRPSMNNEKIEFLVDADSNYFLPFTMDDNKDGIISEDEQDVYPGLEYDVSSFPKFKKGLIEPTTEDNFTSDQWGTFMSAYAPLIRDGKTVAVLEIDMDVTTFLKLTKEKFKIWFWFFGIFIAILLFEIGYLLMKKSSKLI